MPIAAAVPASPSDSKGKPVEPPVIDRAPTKKATRANWRVSVRIEMRITVKFRFADTQLTSAPIAPQRSTPAGRAIQALTASAPAASAVVYAPTPESPPTKRNSWSV
jgi:hypothetical protein